VGIGAIFGPVLDPALYGWARDSAVPVLMIIVALALLVLTIARAKTAMNNATRGAGVVPDEAVATIPKTIGSFEEAQSAPPPNKLQYGLLAKLAFSFAAVSVLLAAAACLIAYQYIYGVVERNYRSRAQAIVMSLSDLTRQQIGHGNIRELAAVVDKYRLLPAIAYVYVEDGDGKIVANIPDDLPRYLNRDFPRSAERAVRGTEALYRDAAVYEIAQRVGDKSGYAHLGIWRTAIENEAKLAVAPMALAIFAVLIGAVGTFVFVMRTMNRPFFQLVAHAERISKGDLVVPLELKRTDEIGDIARSLERMRSSLRAVVARLDQGHLTKQSGL
jgi:HAMP domain-containing protein